MIAEVNAFPHRQIVLDPHREVFSCIQRKVRCRVSSICQIQTRRRERDAVLMIFERSLFLGCINLILLSAMLPMNEGIGRATYLLIKRKYFFMFVEPCFASELTLCLFMYSLQNGRIRFVHDNFQL